MSKQRKKSKKIQKPAEKLTLRQKLGRGLVVLLVMTLIAAPPVLWIVLTSEPGIPNSGFIALGGAGAFLLGLDLPVLGFLLIGTIVNWVGDAKKRRSGNEAATAEEAEAAEAKAAEEKRNWRGFALPVLLVAAAALLLIAYASVALFVPQVYAKFNETHVTFCAVSWVVALVWMFFGLQPLYVNAEDRLRAEHVSMTSIRRARKTLAGKLWFAGLKRRGARRAIAVYRVFLAVTAAALAMLLCFFWNTVVLTAAGALLTLLSAALIPIQLRCGMAAKEEPNRRERTRKAVMFIFWCAYFAAATWLEAQMTLDLWR